MAGWDIAGKNDAPPQSIPFRRRNTCSLTKGNKPQNRELTPQANRYLFGATCMHAGCQACGPRQARTRLLPLAASLEHIKSPATNLVLHWPVIEIGPAGLLGLSQFLDAARLLALLLDQGLFGEFAVWCLVSEVAVLNPSQTRLHAHFVCVQPSAGIIPFIRGIRATWISLGGEWQGNEACTFGSGLAPSLRYLAKGPLGKSYGSSAGESCAHFLLDPYEHVTWEPASVYYRGGTLAATALRRASRARARAMANPDDTKGRDHLGRLHDESIASSLPKSLATLDVEHTIRCPTCSRSGPFVTRHGRDAHGRQRWRCKNCVRTFRDRPISQGHAEHVDDVRLGSAIRNLIDGEGMSLHRAAQKAHVGRQRAKRCYEWHLERWPKKASHL